jgi:hypothetical protein
MGKCEKCGVVADSVEGAESQWAWISCSLLIITPDTPAVTPLTTGGDVSRCRVAWWMGSAM